MVPAPLVACLCTNPVAAPILAVGIVTAMIIKATRTNHSSPTGLPNPCVPFNSF